MKKKYSLKSEKIKALFKRKADIEKHVTLNSIDHVEETILKEYRSILMQLIELL